MAGGWGQPLDRQKGLDLRPLEGFGASPRRQALRRYPAGRERGGTVGAALEGYIASNSQWSRWRRGMTLALGAVQGGRLMRDELLATFRSRGALEPRSVKLSFVFPAGRRQLSWLTIVRPRGSLLGLAPLAAEQLEVDTSSEDPADWRLWYSPPGTAAAVASNLRFFQHFIGEFFEDSARPGGNEEPYFERLIEGDEPVKLTLAEVDLSGRRLGFELHRWRQLERGPRGPGRRGQVVERQRQTDRRDEVPSWRLGRVICSSHKFSCSCPDFLGRRYSDVDGESGDRAISNRFPLPSVNRVLGGGGPQDGAVEAREAGNYAQWRTIAQDRMDLWNCKHIHAVRWLCGCPLEEPGDRPPLPEFAELAQGLEEERDSLTVLLKAGEPKAGEEVIHRELYSRRNPDAESAALAVSTGILVEPLTDVYGNERPFNEWGYRSMLWETGREPDPTWCRQNDWWSPVGVFDIFRFDQGNSSFRVSGGNQAGRVFNYEDGAGLRKAVTRYAEYRGPEDNAALQLQYQNDERYRLKFKPVIVR